MNEIIELLTENGIAVGCLVFFMYQQTSQIKAMTETLVELSKILEQIRTMLEK